VLSIRLHRDLEGTDLIGSFLDPLDNHFLVYLALTHVFGCLEDAINLFITVDAEVQILRLSLLRLNDCGLVMVKL